MTAESDIVSPSPEAAAILDAAVTAMLARGGPHLAIAGPLGLGKPHRLLNAIYARISADPGSSLRLYTALSLDPPSGGGDLEKRFLQPFVARHFGVDFPRLQYTVAQKRNALPDNVTVEEFYLQSGAMLGSTQAQSSYSSLNYTHVARAVAARGINVLVQKVAREPGGSRLSLSCNPDLSFDLLDEIARQGQARPMVVAEVDPELPWIGGSACVPADFFDLVLDLPGPAPKLFALPRQPVSDGEFAIGLYASTLVRDGGTLQIGIGSLSDALCHALILRHRDNAGYLEILEALSPGLADSAVVRAIGGTAPFVEGLYGASEMVNDGFMRLQQAGILVRRVVDDVAAMQRINGGLATAVDLAALAEHGHWLNGGFYLGSHDLYRWLREMPAEVARGMGMTRISHINDLYGGNEVLERLQRRDARFFNTCMMMTALGAAISDGLADGRLVSGVGGQYNFVAMAHALHDGRSILLLRAIREQRGRTLSSVLWNYGHCTIPRHLRDVVVTEYGIADLRVASDAECVQAMLALTDVRFQPELLAAARAAGKLPKSFQPAAALAGNTQARLSATLAPFRQRGLLPDSPIGCDFTAVEQRLVRALAWLKKATAGTGGKVGTVVRALAAAPGGDAAALQRMQLDRPRGWRARLDARLLALALRASAADTP
jgi:acyl-CoA hydrolase